MSDETKKTTPEATKSMVQSPEPVADQPTETAAKKPPHKKKTGRHHPIPWLGVIALVAAAGAAAVAGYDFLLWQRHSPELASLVKGAAETETNIAALQQSVEETQGNLNGATRLLRDEQAAITTAVEAINARLGRTTVGWRLAEVEHLLVIANDRLALDGDRHTALLALRNADSKLQLIGDPAFLPVRKAISTEVTALNGVEEPDITGMALALGSLIESVSSLPIENKALDLRQAEESTTSESGRSWQQVLHGVWEDIKSLVRVRRHDQPVEPLLPPDEEWYLRQNLRLKLEEARLSLVRRDTAVFRQSLAASKQWVSAYFDVEASVVSSLLKTVENLGQATLDPALPDISASLRQLREQMRRVGELAAENQP